MNLEDLKERLLSDAKNTWERVQESTAYNQLRDRYENMSPPMQKLTLVGSAVVIALVIISIPYGKLTQSKEYVSEFESKRMTIRELLKVTREASEVPQIPQAPPIESVRTNIEGQLKLANLLPEQMRGIEPLNDSTPLIPATLLSGGLQISLVKLNVRQVVDIGYQIQNINPSLKLKDLTMTANQEDSRYFDVVFKVVALAVPAPPEVPVEEPTRGGRNRGRGGGGN